MSSSTRKISTSEWDRHKDLIVDLYRVNTLKDVRAVMESQHGFEASPWQYEIQLKRWNIRKNATRKEWQQYFAANDDQPVTTSLDDTGRIFSPVILSKSTASKKRASRWVSGISVNSTTSRASHSTQPSNGPCPPARLVPNEPYVPETTTEANVQDTCLDIAIVPSVFANFSLCMDRLFDISATNDVDTHVDSPRALFHNVNELTQSLGLISTTLPTYSSTVVPDSLFPYSGHDSPGRATFASFEISAENNVIFFSMLREDNFRRVLPSGQLEHDLRSKGIVLNQESGSTMLGGFAAKFVARILSSNNHSTDTKRPTTQLQHFLRKLGSQVPGESSDLITNDQAFETKFARALIFSMLNGFAGLDDIPMENILRFLNRFVINKLLLDILKQCPKYALRTLADNIFRATIEAADTKVLALLLSHKLVDVNKTICLHKGKKYIPIERAAVLGCPKFVKSLIDAGADVKGALRVFLDGIVDYLRADRQSNIPPDLCEILNLLVSAGAQVHPRMMILRFGGRALGIDLIISQNIDAEHHQDFFQAEPGLTEENAPVRYVARDFEDSCAAKSIQKAINLCHQSNCNKCVASAGINLRNLRNAAIDAASKGKLETLRLLLDKAELNAEQLSRILISAIESSSRPVIDFILSLGPELDPPAMGYQDSNMCDLTVFKTPIAETVRCANVDLRRELEESGCLDHVTEGDRFGALVQAAAEAGNVAYMKDLLACAVTSKKAYRESGAALALALRGGHKDIVQMLLEAGAIFSTHPSWGDDSKSLVKALDKEEIRMTHALIAAGADEDQIGDHVAQVDYSLVVDVVLEYPGFGLDDIEHLFSEFLKKDALEAFRDMLQHIKTSDTSLEDCLRMAVKIGHVDMVGYLLDIGANPFSDIVLRGAIADRPDMLPLMLQTGNSRRTMPKCIGASSLTPLMGHGAGNAEALDELIRIRAINFTRPEYLVNEWGFLDGSSGRLTPLGMAIQGVPNRFESNTVTMRKFLDAGADPNGIAESKKQWTKGSPLMTGLMVAIETGLEEAVNILLDYGADVNARPRIRTTRTALQYAAELGNLEMVRLLLRRGADVNSTASSRGGATAIQFAAMTGNCNLVAYLLDHGAQLGALPSRIDGMWPLEGAAANGRLDMIRYLWEINVRLVAGGTFLNGFSERHCLRAMNFARENGHFGCRDFISDLSGIAVERLETDEYGAPWIAY